MAVSKNGAIAAVVAIVTVGCSVILALLLWFRSTTPSMQASVSSHATVLQDLLYGGSIAPFQTNKDSSENEIVCLQPSWCDIPMPSVSHFRFPPPDDPRRWKIAQSQAASGEQVLLRGVRSVFTNHMDFLDGDQRFRRYHELADIFLDHNTDLVELTKPEPTNMNEKKAGTSVRKQYQWQKWGHKQPVLPPTYDFRYANRAPIVMVGYNAFSTANLSSLFDGPFIGQAHVDLNELTYQWNKVKNDIKVPFILLHAGNENWGLFSTEFPNRTASWQNCCERWPVVMEILNHPMTMAVLTNQHHNITHPKLLSLPRGVPNFVPNRKRLLFDLLRIYEQGAVRKESLVFASSSDWKHRPFVSACIAAKFTGEDTMERTGYTVRAGVSIKGRMDAGEYYRKLASSRTVIALAGLGYDSFRLWETLMMGALPVIEKGIGLDKTLWRLPALLVEDYDMVTPQLLRAAYVEALYRAEAGQFEFRRLTQSYWWSFIMNVSAAGAATTATATTPVVPITATTTTDTSSRSQQQQSLSLSQIQARAQAVIDSQFPSEAEDGSFARPRVPYSCGANMEECGPGTKRPPRSSCGGKP